MSNFEHHRKRAKQILRWHRERHFPVAQQIRTALPRFQNQTDREILDADFKLSDAQNVVAREVGCEDWEALKRATVGGTRTPAQTHDASSIVAATPFLWVRDLARTMRYFETQLGFEIAFDYGDPPFYAEVERNGVHFALRCIDEGYFQALGDRREREELPVATLHVRAIKALYLELEDNGARFFQKLRTEPWGARSFIVSDPDGNLIAFAESPDAGETA
mgnify:CR=1 FL=1